MPSKSTAQRRFMAAASHNADFAAKVGISQAVAREFHEKDKGKYGALTKSGKKKKPKHRRFGQLGGE
jgi:hypothetical protein